MNLSPVSADEFAFEEETVEAEKGGKGGVTPAQTTPAAGERKRKRAAALVGKAAPTKRKSSGGVQAGSAKRRRSSGAARAAAVDTSDSDVAKCRVLGRLVVSSAIDGALPTYHGMDEDVMKALRRVQRRQVTQAMDAAQYAAVFGAIPPETPVVLQEVRDIVAILGPKAPTTKRSSGMMTTGGRRAIVATVKPPLKTAYDVETSTLTLVVPFKVTLQPVK